MSEVNIRLPQSTLRILHQLATTGLLHSQDPNIDLETASRMLSNLEILIHSDEVLSVAVRECISQRFHHKDADDILLGGEGDDELYGRGGDDRLEGDTGYDGVCGGAGSDELDLGGDATERFQLGNEGRHDDDVCGCVCLAMVAMKFLWIF